MRSPGINGEGELRGQPANPGSPGKMAVKMECVCARIVTNKQTNADEKMTSLVEARMAFHIKYKRSLYQEIHTVTHACTYGSSPNNFLTYNNEKEEF